MILIPLLSSLYCRLTGHKWRRARNGEAGGCRYCNRCGLARAVRARKAKAAT